MVTSHTAPPPPGAPALGASLRRSSSDRLMLGVCGGIAQAIGASPLAIRVATLALGCILLPLVVAIYAGVALIVPRDDGSALIGNGTRDGRDIAVVLLYLTIAAPLVLGAAGTSFFGGVAAWPALLAASIVAFVLAIWRPKALFGRAGAAGPAWAPTPQGAPGDGDRPARRAATAATTVSPAFGDPFHGTVTGPYPDGESFDTAEAATAIGDAAGHHDAPTFVKGNGPAAAGEATFVAQAPQPGPPAARVRRRSIALPILSVLALVPALFVVLVAVGAVDGAWSAWSVTLAVMAVGAAGGAVAVALLRPSYLGAGFLVVLAAILGAGSIGLSQLGPVLDDGLGDRSFVPASLGELPPQYMLGIGELNVDLRQLKLRPGSTTVVHAKLGFGQMRVIVPKGVRVVATPGSQVPGLVTTAQRNGATAKSSASAPVIALDLQARGAQLDLLGGSAVHYENMTVLSSQATGFWGSTDEPASPAGVPAASRP